MVNVTAMIASPDVAEGTKSRDQCRGPGARAGRDGCGSTRVARRAGTQQASSAAVAITVPTAANVSGSVVRCSVPMIATDEQLNQKHTRRRVALR